MKRFTFFFFTILLQHYSQIHIQISKNVKELLCMRTKALFVESSDQDMKIFISSLRVRDWLTDLFSTPWGHPLVGLGVFLGPFIRILKVEWEYLCLLDVSATKNALLGCIHHKKKVNIGIDENNLNRIIIIIIRVVCRSSPPNVYNSDLNRLQKTFIKWHEIIWEAIKNNTLNELRPSKLKIKYTLGVK